MYVCIIGWQSVTRCAGRCPDDMQCRFTSACSFAAARPLREGGTFCTRHLWQGWVPPSDCAGVAGVCTAALGPNTDESVAESLDLEYCDACQASWRVLGGWCDADDERAWYEARGLDAPSRIVRCHAVARHGARCRVNSLCPHAGADPLRTGARFCAVQSC